MRKYLIYQGRESADDSFGTRFVFDEIERILSKAFDTMINLAEETFNILSEKIWHQTVSLLREECKEAPHSTLCELFDYSRQSYYKRSVDDYAEDAIGLIVKKTREYRKDNPGLGCVKLYVIIKSLFEETGCMPGRDAFIELLRKNGIMVQIKCRRRYRTTDSNHNYFNIQI